MSEIVKNTNGVHPIQVPQAVFFDTNEITRIQEQILRWLWTGCTGGYIKGQARFGKSTAIEFIQNGVRLQNGQPVPHELLTIPPRDKPSVNALLRTLCLSVGLRVTNSSKPDVMESDYLSYILDQATVYDTHQFVLFVDEMQRLATKQLDLFALLYDRLRLLDVALMTVFIGNTYGIEPLLDFVKQPSNEHLRGRFFCQHETFHGLSSSKDISFCLKQYDKLTYPPGSNITFTKYFLPDAPAKWKLASLAPLIWQVFRAYQKNYGIKALGMQYFRSTVDTLLTNFLPRYGINEVNGEMIAQCFELSGIVASQVTVDNVSP